MFHTKHANSISNTLENLNGAFRYDAAAGCSYYPGDCPVTPEDVIGLFNCMNDHYHAEGCPPDKWDQYPRLRDYTAEARNEA